MILKHPKNLFVVLLEGRCVHEGNMTWKTSNSNLIFNDDIQFWIQARAPIPVRVDRFSYFFPIPVRGKIGTWCVGLLFV
jgi:hypothetical protein